ncbi:hypothetical protein ACFU8T_03635 [Sphingobacterium spiritivorum]|nr:hypothetical protein [Sphingobacterium spiritivorum]QQT37419.1 hypothetical protein I6J01_08470 [Sphingobacterium spiritivorum]WQD34212.1 hypothetical protein U0038_00405 [Sphingobacterium spiritivorum]SUI97035.1 Uncharacterised protein [Sphingobacterium spiritivorum]
MKIIFNAFWLSLFIILLACNESKIDNSQSQKEDSTVMEIYYENGDVDDSGYKFPDFEEEQKKYSYLFRDLGQKYLDAASFEYLYNNVDNGPYNKSTEESMRYSGDFKIYILLRGIKKDSIVLNIDNNFYSLSKKQGFQNDSLAYLIRNTIGHYNILTSDELTDFKEFHKFRKYIKYVYQSPDEDKSKPPTWFSKIILRPEASY